MSAIALEVSRRMTPEYARSYAKERASEMARDTTMEVRDRAVGSPWFIPLLGAGIGALVGKALLSRAQDQRHHARYERYERSYGRSFGAGVGYHRRATAYDDEPETFRRYGVEPRDLEGEDAGLGDRAEDLRDHASSKADELRERASSKADELGDRASAKADEVRDRLRQGANAIRERIPDADQLRSSAREDTGLWAFGAVALGMLFGMALPVTQRERELLEPARRKLREAGEQAKEMAIEKGKEAVHVAADTLTSGGEKHDDGEEREQGHEGPSTPASTTGSSLPLH